MKKSKTLFGNLKKSDNHYIRTKYIKDFIYRIQYSVRNKWIMLQQTIQSNEHLSGTIAYIKSIIFTTLIISIMIIAFNSKNVFGTGLAVTIFLELLLTYTKQFRDIFVNE